MKFWLLILTAIAADHGGSPRRPVMQQSDQYFRKITFQADLKTTGPRDNRWACENGKVHLLNQSALSTQRANPPAFDKEANREIVDKIFNDYPNEHIYFHLDDFAKQFAGTHTETYAYWMALLSCTHGAGMTDLPDALCAWHADLALRYSPLPLSPARQCLLADTYHRAGEAKACETYKAGCDDEELKSKLFCQTTEIPKANEALLSLVLSGNPAQKDRYLRLVTSLMDGPRFKEYKGFLRKLAGRVISDCSVLEPETLFAYPKFVQSLAETPRLKKLLQFASQGKAKMVQSLLDEGHLEMALPSLIRFSDEAPLSESFHLKPPHAEKKKQLDRAIADLGVKSPDSKIASPKANTLPSQPSSDRLARHKIENPSQIEALLDSPTWQCTPDYMTDRELARQKLSADPDLQKQWDASLGATRAELQKKQLARILSDWREGKKDFLSTRISIMELRDRSADSDFRDKLVDLTIALSLDAKEEKLLRWVFQRPPPDLTADQWSSEVEKIKPLLFETAISSNPSHHEWYRHLLRATPWKFKDSIRYSSPDPENVFCNLTALPEQLQRPIETTQELDITAFLSRYFPSVLKDFPERVAQGNFHPVSVRAQKLISFSSGGGLQNFPEAFPLGLGLLYGQSHQWVGGELLKKLPLSLAQKREILKSPLRNAETAFFQRGILKQMPEEKIAFDNAVLAKLSDKTLTLDSDFISGLRFYKLTEHPQFWPRLADRLLDSSDKIQDDILETRLLFLLDGNNPSMHLSNPLLIPVIEKLFKAKGRDIPVCLLAGDMQEQAKTFIEDIRKHCRDFPELLLWALLRIDADNPSIQKEVTELLPEIERTLVLDAIALQGAKAKWALPAIYKRLEKQLSGQVPRTEDERRSWSFAIWTTAQAVKSITPDLSGVRNVLQQKSNSLTDVNDKFLISHFIRDIERRMEQSPPEKPQK